MFSCSQIHTTGYRLNSLDFSVWNFVRLIPCKNSKYTYIVTHIPNTSLSKISLDSVEVFTEIGVKGGSNKTLNK